MNYFISFLEGFITFISPCLLPMIPIYISYFAADKKDNRSLVGNAISFVLGFATVFILLGAFASAIGGLLVEYRTLLSIVCGVVIIIFGLSILGVFDLKIFKGSALKIEKKNTLLSAFVFGVVFSIGWTPCVGAFLGSALMLAAQQGSVFEGVIMLLCYSIGLGIPFICCALFIDKLKSSFDIIKRNYKKINLVCGVFLIVIGLAMIFGLMGKYYGLIG